MVLFTFSFNAFPLFLSFTLIFLFTFTLELCFCFRKVRKIFSYLLYSSQSWVQFYFFIFYLFKAGYGFMIVELYMSLIISLSATSHNGISRYCGTAEWLCVKRRERLNADRLVAFPCTCWAINFHVCPFFTIFRVEVTSKNYVSCCHFLLTISYWSPNW